MKIIYLFVEGNTDKFVVESLLKRRLKYRNYVNEKDTPKLLSCHIPKYPGANGQLERRGIPSFLYKDDASILLVSANGKEQVCSAIRERLRVAELQFGIANEDISIAVVLDRDAEMNDEVIKSKLLKQAGNNRLVIEKDILTCEDVRYGFSLCIIPADRKGTIEKVVIDIASKIHPELTNEAGLYKKAIEEKEDYRKYRNKWASDPQIQSFYADKVQVGAISTVLKPDSSPGIMINDILITEMDIDQICELPSIKRIVQYLEDL